MPKEPTLRPHVIVDAPRNTASQVDPRITITPVEHTPIVKPTISVPHTKNTPIIETPNIVVRPSDVAAPIIRPTIEVDPAHISQEHVRVNPQVTTTVGSSTTVRPVI